MNKKAIAIASVLKPVDDSRNFEKIGRSLSQTNKYEINIIGFSTKKIPKDQNITFHPLKPFSRISWARWMAPWEIYRKVLKLKPDIMIVNTHELLWVMTLYKILFGFVLLYDVQENYYKNIRYTPTYPAMLRLPLAMYVRMKERLCHLWIDHYLLAEENYYKDMKFTRPKSTIVLNKTTIKPLSKTSYPSPGRKLHKFIYTGTIASNYGIFDALKFIDRLRTADKKVTLTIAGYCAKKSTLTELRELISEKNYIHLIGGEYPIPHQQIVDLLKQSDCALLPYHLDRSLIRCIPTKIYECIALKLPMVIRTNPLWLKLCNQFQACLPSNFTDVDKSFLALLNNKKFYTKGDTESVLWHTEEAKLLELIKNLTEAR